MPWKETDVMSLKKEFVLAALEKGKSFTELCTDYGISTKTGYKWKERFLQEGFAGLVDQPRRPHCSPTRLTEDIICELIRIKTTKLRWGPKKIRELYAHHHPDGPLPSRSTVERVLQKAGLVARRKRRRHISPERLQENGVVVTKPNDLWTVDFKGWWYTSTQEKCEPLTVRDEYSKYILEISILEKADISSVKKAFERLFKKYGLPKVIKSDNGPPFACAMSILGLTRLSAWWLSLGIRLHRIDPGSPQQNGAHERMHLDMKKELEGQIVGDLPRHQKIFRVWRKEYNTVRPHEALGMKTPAMLYEESERTYAHATLEWDYPGGYGCRQVNDRGYFNYQGHKIFLTNALGGYRIGIKPGRKGRAEVWFFKTLLGEIDLQAFVFKSILDK